MAVEYLVEHVSDEVCGVTVLGEHLQGTDQVGFTKHQSFILDLVLSFFEIVNRGALYVS